MMDFRFCRSRSVDVEIHDSLAMSWTVNGQPRDTTAVERRQIPSVRQVQLQIVTGAAVGRCFR
jgi:hypothetical protein